MQAELIVQPRSKAPPKHIHPLQEETFKVVEGSLATCVSGKQFTLRTGQECVVPRSALHTWHNAGETEARVLVEFRPALRADEGLEALYAMAQNGHRNPLQFAVTMWDFRKEGSFPGAGRIVLAVLARLGKLLGYKAHYPYPYNRAQAAS